MPKESERKRTLCEGERGGRDVWVSEERKKEQLSNRRTGSRETDLDFDKANSRCGSSRKGRRGIPGDERLELATKSGLGERDYGGDPAGRGRRDLTPIERALDELLGSSERVGNPTTGDSCGRRSDVNVQSCTGPKQLNTLKRSEPLLEVGSCAEIDLNGVGGGKSNSSHGPINTGALRRNRTAETGRKGSGRSIRRHVGAGERELTFSEVLWTKRN